MSHYFYDWIPLLAASTAAPIKPDPQCRHLLLAAGFCVVTFACIDWIFGADDFPLDTAPQTSITPPP